MMALSLTNITGTNPAAPATPPGVAMADGVFDLLMPIALPTDPRHEPAPDGKQVGKDMPVEETDPGNPLAWLSPLVPSVVAPVSKPEAADPALATIVAATPLVTVSIPGPADQPPSAPIVQSANRTATPVRGKPDVADVLPRPAPQPAAAQTAEAPASVIPRAPEAAPAAPSLSAPSPIPPASTAAVRVTEPSKARPITDQPAASAMQFPTAPARTPPFAPHGSSEDVPPRAAQAVSPLAQNAAPETPSLQPPPRVAPAAQVFADAIHRATRDDRDAATPEAVSLAATDIKTHAVTATADARHNALDLRQENWPARMMERIEALRDAANANDTSIRLIPDALGKIDVSLKRDGDTVAVQFTAHQPETRQLLADAAPKLAELAEARGLKLAQGGADTTGQQQPRQQQAAPAAAAPRRALTDDTESTDTRIA